MKNIVVIQGHPDANSFNFSLGLEYVAGARKSGSEVKTIEVGALSFDPNLMFGYRQRIELEPCLREAQELIAWADHITIIHPVWWGSTPALLKGFIDRVFLPGFAFKKRENSLWWDKLLKGKSGRIISTLDQPPWYYWIAYRAPSIRMLRDMTLKFCGVHPVRTTTIGPLRLSKESFRKKALRRAWRAGFKDAR